MPPINLRIETSHIVARLDAMGPTARQAIADAMAPLAQSLATDSRALALAHIHYLGKKPGLYLASILGGVSLKPNMVVGYVRSGNNLAHLLEDGTKDRYKKTLRSAREVIGQERAGYTGAMPAFPAITPPLANRASEIEATLAAAVNGAKL